MSFVSAVNQPDRVNVSSLDDTNAPLSSAIAAGFNWGSYSRFRINLETPVLNAKSVMMTSAAVPTTGLNIPDYQMALGFYKVPIVAGQPQAGGFTNPANFHFAYASSAQVRQQLNIVTGPFKNRPIASYTDFATFLNDLLAFNAVNLGDAVLTELTFVYDTVEQRIYAQTPAPQSGFAYQFALPGDPNLVSACTAVANAPVSSNQNLNGNYSLTTRIGFAYPTISNTLLAGVCIPGGNNLWPNGFPDLVFTQNVYFYSAFVQGSSVCSNTSHELLAVVGMPVPPLGVSLYETKTKNALRKCAKEIYEIDIQMRDDNNQPFLLPDNAIVNAELQFFYE